MSLIKNGKLKKKPIKEDEMDLVEQYLGEAKKPPKGTLYVDWSSVFDSPSNRYDVKGFMKVLKDAGAKKVWSDNKWGWSNQPEVVLFKGLDERKAKEALENSYPFFKKWGVLIRDANMDWE